MTRKTIGGAATGILAAALASPVLAHPGAHPGAHLHPQDGGWIGLLVAAAVIVAAGRIASKG